MTQQLRRKAKYYRGLSTNMARAVLGKMAGAIVDETISVCVAHLHGIECHRPYFRRVTRRTK